VTETAIRDRVIHALRGIAPEVDPAALDTRANLREEVDLDSFDHLNFMIALAEEFGVDVPESEYPRLMTVDDIVAWIMAHAPT